VSCTIPQALDRLKGNLARYLPAALVFSICRDLGRDYRDRTLTPLATTLLFVQQILHGNCACGLLRHLSGLDFTDSAYCQARARLPFGFFQRLLTAVTGRCRRLDPAAATELWHGHRVFLLDGSSFSMPDTAELRAEFGQPAAQAAGCGFPVAHLLVLFDAQTGYLLRAVPAPLRTHDLAHAAWMHQDLAAGDVLAGDRAFGSYAHLALLHGRGLHGLFRAHQRQLIDFRPGRPHVPPGGSARGQKGVPRSRWLKRLGKDDQVVEYHKPKECPSWLTAEQYAALPETLVVRELRYPVRTPGGRVRGVTLVTTLLNRRRYPARALARLYARRWQAEVNLRHLKEAMQMAVLRCKTFVGVMKELTVFVAVYNLVRRVMRQAAKRQGVPVDRVSFTDALRWLWASRAGDEVPRLKVNPERPGRVEPRVRKRRPKQYPLMRKPRAVLRKALLDKLPTP
jgi:hypothetical protein